MAKERSAQWLRDIATAPPENITTMATSAYPGNRDEAFKRWRTARYYALEFQKAKKQVPKYLEVVLKVFGDRLF